MAVVAAADKNVYVLGVELDAYKWRYGLECHFGLVGILHVPYVRVDAHLIAILLKLQVAIGSSYLFRAVNVPRYVVGRALHRVRVSEHVDRLGRGYLVVLLRMHLVEIQLVNVDRIVLFDYMLHGLIIKRVKFVQL